MSEHAGADRAQDRRVVERGGTSEGRSAALGRGGSPGSIPETLLSLQRSVGNRATLAMLAFRSRTDAGAGGEPRELDADRPDRVALPQVHAATHSGGDEERPAGRLQRGTDGPRVVRRKLVGTREAILALGGESSLGNRIKRSTYTKILSALDQYEKLEAGVVSKRDLDAKSKQQMSTLLGEIDGLVDAWLKGHGRIDADNARNRANEAALAEEPSATLDRTADETRSHALIMLKPRLANERRELERPDYLTRKAYSDNTLTAKTDDAFGGGVNRLDAVTHGAEKGVFMQDRGWETSGTAGKDLGIPEVDANAGARSVAMSRLAELLEVDVIAKTEFATHTSKTGEKNRPLASPVAKLGVRQELAFGGTAREAAETPATITARERTDQGQVSLEDPRLQKSLNIIQVIDAIAGQLDRHWHNYFIATRDGKVEGVVGIDLDMAFAVDHRSVDPTPVDRKGRPVTKSNFVGMPALADAAFRTKVLGLKASDLRNALEGLITPAELDSTITRFGLVQDALGKMDKSKVVGEWTPETAKEQHDEKTSYLGKMRGGIILHSFTTPAEDRLRRVVQDEQGWDDYQGVAKALVANNLEKKVTDGKLTPAEALSVVDVLVETIRTDPAWLALWATSKKLLAESQAGVPGIQAQAKASSTQVMQLSLQIDQLKKEGSTPPDKLKALEEQLELESRNKVALNERVNQLNMPDWFREMRKKRDVWLVSVVKTGEELVSQKGEARGGPAEESAEPKPPEVVPPVQEAQAQSAFHQLNEQSPPQQAPPQQSGPAPRERSGWKVGTAPASWKVGEVPADV